MSSLGEGISHLKRLKALKLILGENNLGVEGIKNIATGIHNLNELQDLSLFLGYKIEIN